MSLFQTRGCVYPKKQFIKRMICENWNCDIDRDDFIDKVFEKILKKENFTYDDLIGIKHVFDFHMKNNIQIRIQEYDVIEKEKKLIFDYSITYW